MSNRLTTRLIINALYFLLMLDIYNIGTFSTQNGKKNAFARPAGIDFSRSGQKRHPRLLYIDSPHVSLFTLNIVVSF